MNIFPVLVVEKVEAPWNIHCLNLDTLPAVDVSESEAQLNVAVHLHCSATYREQSLRDSNDHTDALLNVKNTIHVIVSKFKDSGVRVFEMRTNNHVDTIIFVTALRLDLASHGYVIDAQVLTLTEFTTLNLKDTLAAIHPETRFIEFYGEEAAAWKRLLPAFAERCRTWKHGQNCEYLAEKKIPLSLEHHRDPLCSCGEGKDVTPEFRKEETWRPAIPYVTRIAIGPLYGVPYMENVGRLMDWLVAAKPSESEKRCQKCKGLGKPKLLVCGGCKGVNYCSTGCQKADWKSHKGTCRK